MAKPKLTAFKIVMWSGEIDSVERVDSSPETVWAENGESHGGPERNKFVEYVMAVDDNAARVEALARHTKRKRMEA